MKHAILVAGSLLLALTTAGVAQSADPIKVGAIYPLSGGAGPQGQHVVQAIETMAEIINEKGGVLGRQLTVISRDDESTPAVGVSRANELIAEGVSVVFEGWNSPVALAMQPLFNRADILDITTSAQADAIVSGEGNPLAIRLNTSSSQVGGIVADILLDKLGAKRLAWLSQNDAYGNGAMASQQKALEEKGGEYEIVATEQFPFEQADFRIALTNVKGKNPDATVLISASQGQGLPALIRQASRIRLPGAIVASPGTVTPDVVNLAGEGANGLLGADIYFPEIAPFSEFETNKEFVAKYQEKTGGLPDKNDALAAAAVQVWAMAANELNTLDKEPIAKHVRGGSFSGTILGDFAFLDNGQSKLNLYTFEVKDGKIVTEKPE
jgi:branched-chain amino acid transport system substrate-binding protein